MTIPHGGPSGLRTRMRSAERGVNPGDFYATGGRLVFATGLQGGVWQDSGSRCGKATFLYLTHFSVVISRESTPPCRTGKKEGDESDPPPKAGGM